MTSNDGLLELPARLAAQFLDWFIATPVHVLMVITVVLTVVGFLGVRPPPNNRPAAYRATNS
jgi:hypothetical protein